MSATETCQSVEYKTIRSTYGDPEDRLNDLAAEGWEVVEPIQRDGHTVMFLLEREVGGDPGA